MITASVDAPAAPLTPSARPCPAEPAPNTQPALLARPGRTRRMPFATLLPLISYMAPVYEEARGNATMLYLTDGRIEIIDRGIGTLRRLYLKHYFLNLADLRGFYKEVTGKSQGVPLVATAGSATFIPVKTRLGKDIIAAHDGTTGYLNVNHMVKKVRKKRQELCVTLVGGQTVTLYMTEATLADRVRHVHLIRRLMRARCGLPWE